jgi:hypothetical protein
MPGPAELAEFLGVNVDQLARMTALISIRRFRRIDPGDPIQPEAGQHQRDRRNSDGKLLGDPWTRPSVPTPKLLDRFDQRRADSRR